MSTINEALDALQQQMDAIRATIKADGSGDKVMVKLSKSGKAKAPKAEKLKKERANADQPTLHGDWTKHVLKLHSTESPEYRAWLAARIAAAKAGQLFYNKSHAKVKNHKKQVGDVMDEKEAAAGAHLPWVGYWRTEHPDEFEQFKTAWEAANPKESRVASSKTSQASSSDAEAEEGGGGDVVKPKKRGAKKYADMTPEELVAAKAKRAAAKASKAASKAETEEEEAAEFAPEIAPAHSASVGGALSVGGAAGSPAEAADEEEESDDSLIPFTHKKVKYLRFGHLDEDGEGVWHEDGDLWLATPSGGKGAYAGKLQLSGKIDSSPEAMAQEPDVN
jgi:hypothetical protein